MTDEIDAENGGTRTSNANRLSNEETRIFTILMAVGKTLFAVVVLALLMTTPISNRWFIEKVNDGNVEEDRLIFIRPSHYFCSQPEGRAIKEPSNISIFVELSLPFDTIFLTERLRRLGQCRAKAATLWMSRTRFPESDLCACGLYRHVIFLIVAAVLTIVLTCLPLVTHAFGSSPADVDHRVECCNIAILLAWGLGLSIYSFFELSEADFVRVASYTDSRILYFPLYSIHTGVIYFACLIIMTCSLELVQPYYLNTLKIRILMRFPCCKANELTNQAEGSPVDRTSSSPKTAYNYSPEQKEDANSQNESGRFLALNPNGKDDVEAIEFYLQMRLFQSGINQTRKEKTCRDEDRSRRAKSCRF